MMKESWPLMVEGLTLDIDYSLLGLAYKSSKCLYNCGVQIQTTASFIDVCYSIGLI